jgi:dolichyl-diphosphooligosaccharide--protein glycosyltransferase
VGLWICINADERSANLHRPWDTSKNTNYFIADALLSSNPVYTADTLRFLARGGLSSLEAEVENRTALTQIMIDNRDKPAPAVYLMLTDQMTGWIPSISKIGRWDIDLGAPILAKGHKTGQNLVYNFLNCADSKVPGLIRCNDSAVDLREGKIDGNSVLDLVVEAHGGRLIGSKRFRDDALNMFQIMKDRNGEVAKVALLHEELFYSSFNQMFHLGRFDTKNFKLVYDDYPHARIFKLLPAPR